MIHFSRCSRELRSKLAAEAIRSTLIGKLYFVFQWRNAWNWTWSTTYSENAAFHLSLDRAKDHAEANRVQGSTWKIEELPTLVVSGAEYAILASEINTDAPLSGLSHRICGGSLVDLADLLELVSVRRDIKTFVAKGDEVVAAQRPFRAHKSVSYSGSEPLGWYAVDDYKPRPQAISRLVKWIKELAVTKDGLM